MPLGTPLALLGVKDEGDYMKQVIFIAATVLMSLSAMAQEHQDSGSRTSASTKPSRAAQIREYGMNCGQHEMDLFEQRKGRLPTNEEMDMILDACVNPSFK